MRSRHWLINFFRWDARTILAVVLGLAIMVGFAWAAAQASLVMKFDFGGGSTSDNETGAIQVKGGLSAYPKISGSWQYGWVNASINEFVDRSVTDKMKRDYNSGDNGSVFRISGLDPGNYSLKATVGASDTALSTRIRSGTLATSVTTTSGNWSVATLNLAVDNSGEIDLEFSSANGADAWGICGLSVYMLSEAVGTPGFQVALTPNQKTMRAGDTGVFSVGVEPLNNYASRVSAEISGLVTGMTAEFTPAQINLPPGTMELKIYTATTVPPTLYDLVITVRGNDAAATQQVLHLKLTLVAANSTLPLTNQTNLTNSTNVIGGDDTQTPDLPPRTAKETKEDFAKIESFAAEQKAKALQQKNFGDMKTIGDDLAAGAPVYTDLPEPTTTTESILQKMVTTGIIGTISDAAPQVQPTPKPAGFWQKVFQGIFRPAS